MTPFPSFPYGKDRFRDYMKRSLSNLISDYFRRQQKRPEALDERQAGGPAAREDQRYLQIWKEQLLSEAWQALEQASQPLYSVLRLQRDMPTGQLWIWLPNATDQAADYKQGCSSP
jgi:DNA-directed RNA polymerase specialized sigma24 family protein